MFFEVKPIVLDWIGIKFILFDPTVRKEFIQLKHDVGAS